MLKYIAMVEYRLYFKLTKDTSYLTLTGLTGEL